MSSAAILRRGTAQDVDAVLRLAAASNEAPHWSRAIYQDIVERRARVDVESDNPGVQRVLFIAESLAIDAFAVGAVASEEAELESVVVAASKQRQGIGRGLCLAVMEWARAAGAAQMRLEVRASNAGAQALYRGLGFEQVGLRRGYYQAPLDDAVQMNVRLMACRQGPADL